MTRPKFRQLKLKQKIALLLFGLFLFFVLLETSLRLGGFILLSLQEQRNLQSIKQKGTYRILCLGESTTQNQYPRFLEPILNQSRSGIAFSVIDKGLGGTNTSVILDQIGSYLDEYNPDMVIAMMGINDEMGYSPLPAAQTICKGKAFISTLKTYKLARLIRLHILTKAGLPLNDPKSLSGLTCIPAADVNENPVEQAPGENEYKKAIELDPKNDDAYVELGRVYQVQGKSQQAKDAFTKASELNPKNAYAYAGLGWFYKNQGQREKARNFYEKAILLNPKNDNMYFQLGLIYQEEGKLAQAEDALKRSIELNPGLREYFSLGWLYLEQDKFSQAEAVFKQAIEFSPENAKTYRAIATLYGEMGKPELEKEYIRKADSLMCAYYNPVTIGNYRKLKKILDGRGIKLVCVQYPLCKVKPLKKIFEEEEGVIFVDNEAVFEKALEKASYKEYFIDMFAGTFGHCTDKGNRLLARNIADSILKEVFR